MVTPGAMEELNSSPSMCLDLMSKFSTSLSLPVSPYPTPTPSPSRSRSLSFFARKNALYLELSTFLMFLSSSSRIALQEACMLRESDLAEGRRRPKRYLNGKSALSLKGSALLRVHFLGHVC